MILKLILILILILDIGIKIDSSINIISDIIVAIHIIYIQIHIDELFCRFNVGDPGCIVTEEAKRMLSRTKELCYLTTIVMRLFEDTSKVCRFSLPKFARRFSLASFVCRI